LIAVLGYADIQVRKYFERKEVSMNDTQLEKKARLDAANVSKDLSNLVGDSAVRLGRLEDSMSQATTKAKNDIATWVGENVSQLSEGLEKATSEARDTVTTTASAVKKDVGHGLSQYNTVAQQAANKVPGDFGFKAARYPWVAMSFALVIGFLLGILIRPARLSFSQD
jgi:ElaB/YqjD/DUF883 family membrane-anchored ribosome-binding protein